MFSTMHVSHSHDPSGFLNLFPKPANPEGAELVVVRAAVMEGKVEAEALTGDAWASVKAGRVRLGFTPVPGLAVSQATHLTTSGLFCTRQVSHSQLPAGGVNKAPKPAEDEEAAEACPSC